MRLLFLVCAGAAWATVLGLASLDLRWLWLLTAVAPLTALGLWDMTQDRHAILRNFPIIGHGRYLAEMVRPEILQYFIETNTSGRPFSREQRSIVYQRAKGVLDTLPFGTQHDVDEEAWEWLNHSLSPVETAAEWDFRTVFGGAECSRPYSASLLNVSAMSYGSISSNAVEALNKAAATGGFAHNTGEGGISRFHLRHGGDLIWQVGTGYFGCRTADGRFDPERYKDNARRETVRMIELKLSQGAKPGHGGILPGVKVSEDIAEARGVPEGEDCISPPRHSAFDSPKGLLEFCAELREMSGGKPVGFKLCIGRRSEFLAICKAMVETGLTPDFVTVDGAEGGTGAAPLEFSNRLGTPITDAVIFVHDALVGFDLRDQVRITAAGKVITAFDLLRLTALGADTVNSARGMMFSIGCIQALRCHSNHCPTGVATQNPELVAGLKVEDKWPRARRWHEETLRSAAELCGACACTAPIELGRRHVMRRLSATDVRSYDEIFPVPAPGSFLSDEPPARYRVPLELADPDRF